MGWAEGGIPASEPPGGIGRPAERGKMKENRRMSLADTRLCNAGMQICPKLLLAASLAWISPPFRLSGNF